MAGVQEWLKNSNWWSNIYFLELSSSSTLCPIKMLHSPFITWNQIEEQIICCLKKKKKKRNTGYQAVSLFKKMYLYVITYWCPKSMHQKCHIDSQLQRKSIFFFFNYEYWKIYVQKKGMCRALETNLQSQYGLWDFWKVRSKQLNCIFALNFKLHFH